MSRENWHSFIKSANNFICRYLMSYRNKTNTAVHTLTILRIFLYRIFNFRYRGFFVEIHCFHNSFYPYIHRKCISFIKGKKCDAVGNFVAYAFYGFKYLNRFIVIRCQKFFSSSSPATYFSQASIIYFALNPALQSFIPCSPAARISVAPGK